MKISLDSLTPPDAVSCNTKSNGLLNIILLAVVTVFSRVNSLTNGFVQDGNILVVENPFIKGWDNLPFIFKSGYWVAIGKTGGLYRPLTLTSLMAEYSLFGLNPLPYHIDNLLLHFFCVVLVYMLLKRTLHSGPGAVSGAMIFAVHPVITEIVATVQGRAELLSVFFLLAGLLIFIKPPRHIPWWAASPLLFLLGMLSKETAAALPLLVVLYMVLFDRDRRGSNVKTIVASLVPYALALGAYMAIRIYAIYDEPVPPADSIPLAAATGYQTFLTMMKAFAHYVRLVFFPTDLLIVYDFPPPASLITFPVVFSLTLLALYVALSLRHFRSYPVAFFFSSWFLIALLPVSNIVPIGIIMSERGLYLPLVAFGALSGWAFTVLRRESTKAGGAFRHASTALLLAAILMLGTLSLDRCTVWKTEAAYFSQVIADYKRYAAIYPDVAKYHKDMAANYIVIGDKQGTENELKRALELDPESHKTHTQLAMLYSDTGRTELAIEEARLADELSGGKDDLALGVIASSLYGKGMQDEAEKILLKAIAAKPDRAEHYINYGLMLKAKGQYDDALDCFRKAVDVMPSMPEAYYRLGMMFGEMQRFDEAADELQRAVSLRPLEPTYRYYLAVACVGAGDEKRAARELKAALKLRPGYREAGALYEVVTGGRPPFE